MVLSWNSWLRGSSRSPFPEPPMHQLLQASASVLECSRARSIEANRLQVFVSTEGDLEVIEPQWSMEFTLQVEFNW